MWLNFLLADVPLTLGDTLGSRHEIESDDIRGHAMILNKNNMNDLEKLYKEAITYDNEYRKGTIVGDAPSQVIGEVLNTSPKLLSLTTHFHLTVKLVKPMKAKFASWRWGINCIM